jgi:hypothetical protein
MSAQPSLQTRIIEVIRANQPLRAKDLCSHLPGIDAPALDCAVTALMRSNKVSLLGAHYDLVQTERPQMQKRRAEEVAEPPPDLRAHTGTRPNGNHPWQQPALEPPQDDCEPPSAAEAAASLSPPEMVELFKCDHCKEPSPDGAFRHSTLGKRFKVCKRCDAEARGFVSRKTPLPESDSLLAKLQRKRDALLARREQLTAEYEAKLKDVIDRAAEIDHLLAEVERLSEGEV